MKLRQITQSVAVIPAFNEEKTVGEVVNKVRKHVRICIVVDDGSTDGSLTAAKRSGATVLKNKMNVGSGEATAHGLKEALKMHPDAIVLMDADGQHDPRYIPALIKQIRARSDCVIASRYLNHTDHVTSWIRRVGTRLISLMLYLRYRIKITDPTSGFRAYSRRAIELLAPQYPTAFSEPETLIMLLNKGLLIKEIPSQMKPRKYGKSSISSLKAIRLMWNIAWKLVFR